MSRLINSTITAAGYTSDIPVYNYRGVRSMYRGFVYGDFDSGTVTAYFTFDTDTANDVALKDYQTGTAVSLTANGYFDFEVMSDAQFPTKIVLEYTGAGTPALNYKVYDNK